MITCAIYIASIGAAFSQTYQHDFQKIIEVPGESLKNYTLCETKEGGFAIVSFLEANGSLDQNRIQIFTTDSDLNVLISERFSYNAVGLYGFEITPNDIYETSSGDFIIAGSLINEGDPSKSGGFLTLIKRIDDTRLDFGWMQIYPSESVPDQMAMHSLSRVVETNEGFIAIGQGYDILPLGVVIRTDNGGNVIWSKNIFDEEYKFNKYSVLTDIVYVNEEEVAIVGNVNGFPEDDADIIVVRINNLGDIISNRVYEFIDEPEDVKYTHLERAAAIEFNKDKNELIIAGTVTKKRKGICVEAEYKNILTFGIDFESGDINWSNRHDIGVDLTLDNDNIICTDIDFGKDGYGVSGTVSNNVFGPTNYNGFILRLNEDAAAINLRFYGLENLDQLNRIYNRDGKYVAGGTLYKGSKNYAWLVESYNSIIEECNEKISEASTVEHPMQIKEGEYLKITVPNTPDELRRVKNSFKEYILCERIVVGRGVRTAGISNDDQTKGIASKVYPTIIRDGRVVIENNTNLVSVDVTALNGAIVVKGATLIAGTNMISLANLDKGMYFLVCYNAKGEQELFKIIVE